jgi:hypothetical protein
MRLTKKAAESRIRRALARKGMALHKSRRRIGADNRGGYQVVDISTNCVVGGSRFSLTFDQAAKLAS